MCPYGVQLRGSASDSNLEILERFQSKMLRIITDATWYVRNAVMKTGLTGVIGSTRSAKLQCHLPTETTVSPTDKVLTITSNSLAIT
jgi:hypothetical protein